MKHTTANSFRCPYTGEPLVLAEATDGEIVTGALLSTSGLEFPIVDGMAHLLLPERESYTPVEAREKTYYEQIARGYDDIIDWLFASFYEDEHEVRAGIIDLLALQPSDRVLETGAGTCRDTVAIAQRIGPQGSLYVQDLSPSMLAIGRERMLADGMCDGSHGIVDFSVANAMRLPFADDYFDAAYHFGGFNLFGDHELAFAEMARVVRKGGKVVVGDEGIAPWLRGAEYGEVLINSNQLYAYSPPLAAIPTTARNPALRWVIGNAFWVIDFEVGGGPPAVDLDLPILGRRGGTHRTRYFGKLEGVTPEAKELAERAADSAQLSLHEWLDRAVRAAARVSAPAPDGM